MMTKQQKAKLEKSSGIGHTITFKNKGAPGRKAIGIVEDEVFIMVGDYKHLIQRVKFCDGVGWGGNKYAYRTGYYTYDGRMKNIKWGQYTQFLAETEYREILRKAKEKGWNIF